MNGGRIRQIALHDLLRGPGRAKGRNVGQPKELVASGKSVAQNASKLACGAGEENSVQGHGWFAVGVKKVQLYDM
jgi:hypothetical protein